MCLAQGPQRSDASEAQTRGPRSRVKHSTTEPLRSLNGPVNAHLICGVEKASMAYFTKFDIAVYLVKVNKMSSFIQCVVCFTVCDNASNHMVKFYRTSFIRFVSMYIY